MQNEEACEPKRTKMPGLQWHRMRTCGAANTAGPEKLPGPVQGMRWQRKNYERRLRQPYLSVFPHLPVPGTLPRLRSAWKSGVPSSRAMTASPSIRTRRWLDAARRVNDGREAVGPIMAVADARAIPAHHQPVAVRIDFVNPQRAGRWPRHLRGLARFDEAGGTPQDHAWYPRRPATPQLKQGRRYVFGAAFFIR
jgi:hypothetical protein